ncbi:hypothetical protein GCM10023307_23550 [Lysobacter hankyongensis]|uniref:Uncharacterized protein n=1 Tax=Lysobacter hankyongensis TaxID=1176535 RepID=A0ABP9BKM8_9GAMM
MIVLAAVVATPPLFVTWSVYDAGTPTVKLAALAVFVNVSCGGGCGEFTHTALSPAAPFSWPIGKDTALYRPLPGVGVTAQTVGGVLALKT